MGALYAIVQPAYVFVLATTLPTQSGEQSFVASEQRHAQADMIM